MKSFRRSQPRPKKRLLIAGKDQVILALKEGKALDRIYLQSDIDTATGDIVRKSALDAGVPVNRVPSEKLNSFNIEGHGGVVALISRIQYADLQQIISFTVEKGEVPLFVMLDGVTDIRNIGAIARSAYCFGVHAIIIPEKGVGALQEDAILTSAGALEHIPVCRVRSLMKAVDDLHLNGIRVYAADMNAKNEIHHAVLGEPTAIVLGAEEKGIYPALSKICDDHLRIPMSDQFDSLNVSVAAGVCLYEAYRQRLSS